MAGVKQRVFTGSDTQALHQELDDVSCPICMDYPHNAVLLLCSAHDKGCKSYICDTSYRHSNCLDRFKKLTVNEEDSTLPSSSTRPEESNVEDDGVVEMISEPNQERNDEMISEPNQERNDEMISEPNQERNDEMISEPNQERNDNQGGSGVENPSGSKLNLRCPMCRGEVLGWEVVEEARDYLNLKRRSCSREACSFSGSYQELRRHARRVHPMTRPSDVDPSRERAWRRLENQREYGDIVSAVRSAMPGAVVIGDYVIENGGDRLSGEGNGPLWSTFLLFQMIRSSVDGLPEHRPPRARAWTRHRRPAAAASPLPERRYLWGENLLGLQEDRNDENGLHILSDIGEDDSPVPRRRRRLARSASDEDDQP